VIQLKYSSSTIHSQAPVVVTRMLKLPCGAWHDKVVGVHGELAVRGPCLIGIATSPTITIPVRAGPVYRLPR
jgi:hypothetical protein